jgi:hypothetical protein
MPVTAFNKVAAMLTGLAYILTAVVILTAAALIAAKLFFGMSWRDTLRRLVEFFS